MKIDFHVHTKDRSRCGKATDTEHVHAAINAGLDGIAFTDHGQLTPVERIARLNETHAPFKVFGGIEIGADGEHMIVLGINDDRLETVEWSYPELHAFCKENDGFLALAHPFRYNSDIELDIEQYSPDAIEVCSSSTPPEAAGRVLDIASRLGIHTLSNSDAHKTETLGSYYNVLDRAPANERELIDILRNGQFTAIIPETNSST